MDESDQTAWMCRLVFSVCTGHKVPFHAEGIHFQGKQLHVC